MAPLEQGIVERLVETMNNMPPELRDYLARSTSAGMRVASALIGFIFMLFLGAVFSTIGGLLGALVFARKTPPGIIDVPPPEN
jgi:hypothetical protein